MKMKFITLLVKIIFVVILSVFFVNSGFNQITISVDNLIKIELKK